MNALKESNGMPLYQVIASYGRGLCAVVLALLLAGCGKLGTPQQEGTLVLGMVKEPVIHFYDGSPGEGMTRELAEMLAQEMGLPLTLHLAEDYQELEALALAGKVHLAAYLQRGVTNEPLRYASPLASRSLWLVQMGEEKQRVRTVQDLHNLEIFTPVASAAAVAIKTMAPAIVPQLVEVRYQDEMDIFAEMAAGRIRYAAVDELYLQYASQMYPDLQPILQIPGQRVFAWAVHSVAGDNFLQQVNQFIESTQRDGRWAALRDRYIGYLRRIDAQQAQAFIEDVKSTLPRYKPYFYQAQQETGIDWRKLAALAYQESKWDPLATSPTGVRGMMMLTEATAHNAGVNNRLDAKQSILGGARYLSQIVDALPDSAQHPDRLWLGLAAYNVGPGHIQSGRRLAQQLKKNPDSWFDMKKVLPLLANPHYYSRFKTGRCRGGQAVILVENVRSYYGILAKLEPAYTGSE
jgi:membrane-bound lytic murein transglycosylase F